MPPKLSGEVQLPIEYESVGYRDNYWEFGFDHIASLIIYEDRIVLKDKDIEMPILYKDFKSIKYENPYHIELSNYIIIDYQNDGVDKTAYFTPMGWAPRSAKIYQLLSHAYENRKM